MATGAHGVIRPTPRGRYYAALARLSDDELGALADTLRQVGRLEPGAISACLDRPDSLPSLRAAVADAVFGPPVVQEAAA